MAYFVKNLGTIDFVQSWHMMQDFTNKRTVDTPDEFWIVEHNPVFTLGLAGKKEHLLFTGHNIPVIQCDRGGQITYHGPGQIVIYTLVDLNRIKTSIRQFVEKLENGIIQYLKTLDIDASSNRDAPGVYVQGKKIASLGLKVRKGSTYHGISFNFAMDTLPFTYINVCGYSGLKVTQLKHLTQQVTSFNLCANSIINHVTKLLYTE